MSRVLWITQNLKLKWHETQNFRRITKYANLKIAKRKFHVMRYVWVMESYGKWRWLYKINRQFFLQNKTLSKGNQISMKMVTFKSWKILKSHGKGHGKPWNFKSPKEYEPCVWRLPFQYYHWLYTSLLGKHALNSKKTLADKMTYKQSWKLFFKVIQKLL